MKDRQLCQSEAEARLSSGSAIAVPAITIFLKSSYSTARQHRREEPIAVIETDGRRAYSPPVAEGDLCTEASIEPHVAASLGTWLPILFA